MAIACIFCYILGSYNIFEFYGDMHNMYHSSLVEDDVVESSSHHKRRRLAVANFIGQSGTGKFALVLFCHMNSCVQYETNYYLCTNHVY